MRYWSFTRMLCCPLPVSMQLFQEISGRNPQIGQVFRVIDHQQLPQGNTLDIRRQFARKLLLIYPFCFPISKAFDHGIIIPVSRVYVKQIQQGKNRYGTYPGGCWMIA